MSAPDGATSIQRARSGARRTPAAPPGRRARRTGARRGGSRGPSPRRSSVPKRSFNIALVAATAARELREKTSIQCAMRSSSSPGETSSVANPCSRAHSASRGSPRQQQLARAGLAEHLGQQQRAGVAGHQTDPDLRRDQPDAVRAEAQVAARRELERAADADAVHRRDHGHRSRQHDPREALEAPIVASQAAASASSADCRSSPAEKWSPAPRSTIAAHLRLRAGGLDRVGDRRHRVDVPGVAARLAVPARSAVPCPARRSSTVMSCSPS